MSMTTFQWARLIEGYQPAVEDRAELFEFGESVVIVVADGAGGRAGGAAAAQAVIDHVWATLESSRRPRDARAWCRFLGEIDAALLDDPAAGESTAVVATVSSNGIAGASVGDSGAWLITAAGYEELTAGQRPKPLLGTGAALPMPFAARRFDGTLLLASDGLLKYADPDSICAAARVEDLDAAAHRLIDLVRLRSGQLPDDVAVVLCRRSPATR